MDPTEKIKEIRPTHVDKRNAVAKQGCSSLPDYAVACAHSDAWLYVMASPTGYDVQYHDPHQDCYNAVLGKFFELDYEHEARDQGHTAPALCKEAAIAFAARIAEML